MKINILWNKLTSFGSLLLILGSSHVSATNYECFEPYYLEKGGCFTGVDILYWAAFQKNLEFASMEDIDSETTEPHLAGPGSIRFMEYDWNPGLRAYFGYQSPCDFWDARIILYILPRRSGKKHHG